MSDTPMGTSTCQVIDCGGVVTEYLAGDIGGYASCAKCRTNWDENGDVFAGRFTYASPAGLRYSAPADPIELPTPCLGFASVDEGLVA